VVAWFIPDAAFSLWTDAWRNAALNFMLLVLIALPRAAAYREFTETHALNLSLKR
jgi:hypothetical protein